MSKLHIEVHTSYSAPVPYLPIDVAHDAPIVVVADDNGAVYDVIHCDNASDMNTALWEAQFSFGGNLPVQLP